MHQLPVPLYATSIKDPVSVSKPATIMNRMIKSILLFLLVIPLVSLSHAQQDHKKGVIKVRKPAPSEFFVEIDYIPAYLGGDLIEAINKRMDVGENLSPAPHVVVVEVIIGRSGAVNWCKVKESLGHPFDAEAVNIVRSLGPFDPFKQEGNIWPAKFLLPVRFP